MSYKIEVCAGADIHWAGNALRFETEKEAEEYGQDLMSRWLLVTAVRVVTSEDKVNYAWKDGKITAVGGD